MSSSALIKIAPLYRGELVLDETLRREGRTLYQAGSLKLHGDAPPVVIDHNPDRRIGVVRELTTLADVDGDWIAAYCTLDDPPSWVKRGTPASFSSVTLSRTSANGCERVLSAIVDEVSVVSASHRAVESRAQVWSLRPVERSKVIVDGLLLRPNSGVVLGVR